MRKIALLTVGVALMSAATASAQTKSATKPGYIGVRYDAEVFYPAPAGDRTPVVVKDVSKGSPAEKAGLKSGDEILRINGMSPANGKFAAVARTLTEGDTVTLRIKRDGKEREYTVIAAARPSTYVSMGGDRSVIFSTDSVRRIMRLYLDSARVALDSLKLPRVFVEGDSNNFNIRIMRGALPGDTLLFGKDSMVIRHFREGMPGVDVLRHFEGEFGPGHVFRSVELGNRSIAGAEFTDFDAAAMKSIFGVDHGLLTVRVAPETPAARAGLIAGDVVLKANNRAVTRVADLRSILIAQPETLKLEVLRKGERKTLEIQKLRKGHDD